MDAARNGWAVERLEERLSGERDGGVDGLRFSGWWLAGMEIVLLSSGRRRSAGRCRGLGLFGTVAEEDIGCQVAADFGGYAGESEDCLPGMVDYLEGAGEGEDVVRL